MINFQPNLIHVIDLVEKIIEEGKFPKETSLDEKLFVSWILVNNSILNYKDNNFVYARYQSTLAINVLNELIVEIKEYSSIKRLLLIITDFLDYIRKKDYNHWEFLLSKIPNELASIQIKKARREKFLFDAILGSLVGTVLGLVYILINIVR